MGEREDILRRALERIAAFDYKDNWQMREAREALAEAAACPPDDAQQRLDQIASMARNSGSGMVASSVLLDICGEAAS